MFLGLALVVSGISASAATTGSVIQVSRKLRMSASEPPAPRDYYLDLGQLNGVKVGDLFTVFRVMAVMNENTGDSTNILRIPLGELKVILAGDYTSIARMAAPIDLRELPVMNYPIVMLGDEVELKTSLPFQQ